MAKSSYHAQIKTEKANNSGKRKKFEKGGSKRWLKTRHRIRKDLLR